MIKTKDLKRRVIDRKLQDAMFKKYRKGHYLSYIKLIASVFISLFLLPPHFLSYAEEETEDKYPFLKVLDYAASITRPVKRQLKENNIDLNFFVGVLQGYDNNVNLNPSRDKDAFLQTSLDTEAVYNYTDDIRLKIENDTTNILYYDYTDANLLDIYNTAGLELDLFDDIVTVGGNYTFDIVHFPLDEDGTYLGNQLSTFLKYNATDTFYHKIQYLYLHKQFTQGKILDAKGNRIDDVRQDIRNIIQYEAGISFRKALLRVMYEIYRNGSNDLFFDYYDYWSYKTRASLIFMFTDKLYTIGSLSYQHKEYDDRLSTKNDEHVSDNTYNISTSLLYELSSSFTIAINYSYRENVSNEPLQKYSGSMVTAGVYYTF